MRWCQCSRRFQSRNGAGECLDVVVVVVGWPVIEGDKGNGKEGRNSVTYERECAYGRGGNEMVLLGRR